MKTQLIPVFPFPLLLPCGNPVSQLSFFKKQVMLTSKNRSSRITHVAEPDINRYESLSRETQVQVSVLSRPSCSCPGLRQTGGWSSSCIWGWMIRPGGEEERRASPPSLPPLLTPRLPWQPDKPLLWKQDYILTLFSVRANLSEGIHTPHPWLFSKSFLFQNEEVEGGSPATE